MVQPDVTGSEVDPAIDSHRHLNVTGLPDEDVNMLRGLIRGFRLEIINIDDLPVWRSNDDNDAAAQHVAALKQLLVDKNLLVRRSPEMHQQLALMEKFFGDKHPDLLAATSLGYRLGIGKVTNVYSETQRPEFVGVSDEDLADKYRLVLIALGLLPGGPDNPGPLDRWRDVAACPEHCKGDHGPVEEMDGVEGFHHDIEAPELDDIHCIDLQLGEGSQAVGGWISFVPCVWVPPMFDDPEGKGMRANRNPTVQPMVEIQDERKHILEFTGAEVATISDALRRAGEAVA
jgi:hypothetical protein